MYQLISAIAKPFQGNKRWINVEIGSMSLHHLFLTYSKINAILSNPFLTSSVSFDLNSIRSTQSGMTNTFNQFLTTNGSTTLVTTNVLPIINTRYAKYADAFRAGYKIDPVNSVASIDAILPLSDKKWLRLTRPNTDYNLFYKSCLVTVNGFFHATDASVQGVYVQDGMTSAILANQNQLGIYSFRELGELTYVPITPTMIYKQNDREFFKDRCYVDLGVSNLDKTIMLVLGGYLHVLDSKTFYRVSETSFAIDFNNLPFLDRYYESKEFIDLSSLPLEKTNRNLNQVSIENFFSDENILAYLTLSQTFFVILDNPDIFINKIFVHETKMPGMYITYGVPKYPMVVGAGKHSDYWYTYEDGQYSLTCADGCYHNRIFDTVDVASETSGSANRNPMKAVTYSQAYLLEVGIDN